MNWSRLELGLMEIDHKRVQKNKTKKDKEGERKKKRFFSLNQRRKDPTEMSLEYGINKIKYR